MTGVLRIALALTPLAITPLLLQLIASGRMDFGGGEKDLLLLLPWTLWSLIFAVSSLVLWRCGWTVLRSTAWSAATGLAGLLVAGLALALVGQLGIGGRF